MEVHYINGDPFENELFRRVILSKGAEPFTEALIQELALRGFNEDELREMARAGAIYSRTKNFIIVPSANN